MYDPNYRPSLPFVSLKAKIEVGDPAAKDDLYRKMVEAIRDGSAALDDQFYMLIDDFMGIGDEPGYGEDLQDDAQAYITCLWVDALCSEHAKFQLSKDVRVHAIATLVNITINGL